ncbi:MAG: hypothetical protein JWO09_2604 [Bacteroidetes bacterium]|nr:hypothetical protein [Bacteroidota bacterium]
MPDVYNLAFGPPLEGSETGIKDKDKIKHDDLDKMLSTLLFFAYAYLSEHPTHYIGIDGSCNYRAALYYRKLQGNYETLKDHFSLIAGNKYYIRFKRFDKPGDDLTEDEIIEILTNSIRENIDFRDIKGIPETIEPNIRITNIEDNYNYFTFKL